MNQDVHYPMVELREFREKKRLWIFLFNKIVIVSLKTFKVLHVKPIMGAGKGSCVIANNCLLFQSIYRDGFILNKINLHSLELEDLLFFNDTDPKVFDMVPC
mmetsp:Transcript_2423/g.2372  ORF Transcript_2423/g.2372 Transcript_2423/m.2372 type:complete len:102 (-) Transcript_2423:556-861(-)